jgi:hypothetical protein
LTPTRGAAQIKRPDAPLPRRAGTCHNAQERAARHDRPPDIMSLRGSCQSAMFNIEHSINAKNGQLGVQVNGATAAAMIDTTLLDSNTAGATLVAGGGHTDLRQ